MTIAIVTPKEMENILDDNAKGDYITECQNLWIAYCNGELFDLCNLQDALSWIMVQRQKNKASA